MKQIVIFSFLLLSLSGCNRAEKKEEIAPKASKFVKGQIFVIRADGENVKLGGVALYYVSLKDLKDRAKWIAINSDRIRLLRNYRRDLSNAEAWIREESKDRIFQPEFRTFIRQSEELISSASRRLVENPLLTELNQIESIREENSNLFESTDFRSDPESQWTIGSIYFEWLKKNSTHSTETDADGLFRLMVPASKGYILARASRALSASHEEHYYWIKEIQGTSDEEIMLSSSATVTRQTLKEILDLSERLPGTSSSLLQNEFSLIPMDWTKQCEQTLIQIKKNEARSSSIDEKIRALEERIETVKYESTP